MEKKMSHDENDKVNRKDPATEVVPKAQRRQYSYEYKRRILAEVDACTQPGEVGAILRREGLYYQILGKWRNQFKKQEQNGLDGQKRGPKVDPQASELARLQRENERLRLKLERAELIIAVQKKSLRCSSSRWERIQTKRSDPRGGRIGSASRSAHSLPGTRCASQPGVSCS